MAHKEQRDFCLRVKEKHPDYFRNKKVLDIGSLDINGSNRDLFENCNYLGIDVGEGKNVDFISVGHLFDGPDSYFDTIISTEVFEHDMFYEDTIKNIMRMLKPGGLFVFTCAAPGRPEHGTRRCGEHCAPLLIQISEDWADYYKNLEERDIRRITGFDETFPDGQFQLNNIYLEIPADLYFYGIKGGEKYLTNHIVPDYDKEKFKEHIFVIDAWPDNESKENDLVGLIKILKKYNIDILLSGHYPIKPEIQKMVDYYLFDKNNPLLMHHEYQLHEVGSGRWTALNDWKVENEHEFHHDYAIWETMRNSFNFCKYLNKKYIHFLEYDNLPDLFQYRQAFLERITDQDAIIYEYGKDSSKDEKLPYCATFIFSIRTDVAIKTIDTIKNRWEYFTGKPKGFQLERVFLDKLKQVTNRILLTNYVANNNELNTQAVWNRDHVDRNGARVQIYLGGDENKNLYVHFISGFYEKRASSDYLLEINYLDNKKFVIVPKDAYTLESIGKYKKGAKVKIYHEGVLVFDEYLGKEYSEFRKLNKVTFMDEKRSIPKNINLNFIDGAYVEIENDNETEYDVEFYDNKTNTLIHSTKLKGGWWTKTNKKYYTDWRIKIKSGSYEHEHVFDPSNKRVLISFESKSLGDNLAWMPYVEKFGIVKNCKIVCATFHNKLFKEQYPQIEFVEPGTVVHNLYAQYMIGLFKTDGSVNYDRHPHNPLTIPLPKIASDILGMEYEELKPKIKKYNNKKKRTVTIATHSTAQCKYWNNPIGWQEVVDYLKKMDYEVILLSREEDGYMGNRNPLGVKQHPPGDIEKVIKVIQESELFIGLSSGLSWLAWACDIPTVLVSGFTDDDLEPKNGIYRVINKNVCNGCWSRFDFDAGDWNWCPEHKGTSRQFECSKSITSDMVIEQINKIIS